MAKSAQGDDSASSAKATAAGNAAAGAGAEKKKPKITAAEAKKKLQSAGKKPAGAGAADGGAPEVIGGKPKKKPKANLVLPKDLSRQVGLQPDSEADAAAASQPDKPKPNPNVAIHTTNRDVRETRKIRLLLVAVGLVIAAIVGAVLFLQLRDPGAAQAAAVNAREMAHFKTILLKLDQAKIKPGRGETPVSAIRTALSDLLNAELTQASGGPIDMKTLPNNPELYSLYLAAQFRDGYEKPIQVSLVNGKVVIRSSGADKIDQTGADSAKALGDDWVVSE